MKEYINKLLEKLPKDKIHKILLRLQIIPRRLRIVVFSVLALLFALIILSAIVSLFSKEPKQPQENKIITTRQETKRPSRYASDPQILSMEVEIENLKEELNSVNFSDPSLNPPILDLEVDFGD